MPLPENAARQESAPQHGRSSAALSRRSMLAGAAGASAAGLALTALASSPALAGSAVPHALPDPEDLELSDRIANGEAVVAHVRDFRTGEIDVYRGTSHVRMFDRALAARLGRASQ